MATRTLPVRVWLARRKGVAAGQPMDTQEFRKRLCESFIPVTHQWTRLFGMTDYLVSLWPQGLDASLATPDESALVFYESEQHYKFMSKETPTGRLYGAAHPLLFDGSMNQGGYPTHYEPASGSVLAKPYFGFDTESEFNWSKGAVWALAMRCPNAETATDWVAQYVQPCLGVFPDNKQWIAWAMKGWMALWIRCQEGSIVPLEQFKQRLLALGSSQELLWIHQVGELHVPDDPLIAFPGVDLLFDQSARIVS